MNLEDVPRRDRREILPFSLFLWMQRVFVRSSPISRMTGNGEIGLANYESNVFKVGKDASSTNNGASRHEGAPTTTIPKVAIEQERRAGWCPKRFRIPRRIRPSSRPSEIEPYVEPAFFGNSFQPASSPSFRFIYICVCIKYNTYICIHV